MKRWIFAMALALAGGSAAAQEAPSSPGPAKADPVVAITMTPVAEPWPALSYRLLPLSAERVPGNAAPVYLRIRHELTAGYDELRDQPSKWLELPFDQLPKAEARRLVDRWNGRLQQIAFGARRQFCDWGYTLPEERENAFDILLPDAQEMRNWGRLLQLKARVEIAEGKLEQAIETIQTGLAFSQHVADGPFLINGLVGIALGQSMLVELETLIAQPDAPNLYWALTALPRPMISLRSAMETEQRLGENLFPELIELRDPKATRTDEEWASLLRRLFARIAKVGGKIDSYGIDSPQLKALRNVPLVMLRTHALPEADRYVRDRLGWSELEVKAATPDQKVALYFAARYREIRDEQFKSTYLSPIDALTVRKQTDALMDAARKEPAIALFAEMMPSVQAASVSAARLDRRIAALRVIEAIRLHAAANDGQLPATLDEIKVVPVPVDPLLARPFDFKKVEGGTARLEAEAGPFPPPALRYSLTIRK